jgi:TATA-box binding protein (TBP) (component of TFIID and TFIIIB)
MFNHNHKVENNKLRIVNVVAIFSLGRSINIEQLAKDIKYIILPPNAFASGVGRFNNPPCVFSIFTTGKVLITGLKKFSDAQLAAIHICNIIKTKIPDVCVSSFKITNSTFSTFFGHPLNIGKIHQENINFILNHKKKFPNIVIKSLKKKVSLTVFQSGKINVVGAVDIDTAKQAYETRLSGLNNYIL